MLGADIPWIAPVWVATALLLFSATYVWQSLKPLRRYFLIMGVILLLAFGVNPMLQRTAFWQNLVAGQPVMVFVAIDIAIYTFVTLASVTVL